MTDLDDALRTMLRERARDIEAVPSHLVRPDEPAADEVIDLAPRRPRHTFQLIAASVVTVLALAGALVGLQHLGGRGASPARTGAPSSSTPPVRADGTECKAALPAAWRTAFTTPAALGAPSSSLLLALSATGPALIGRDLGSRQDVALVRPGAAPTSILSVPAQLAPYTGGLYGNYAVVPLYWAPASDITGPLMRLEVINLQTRKTTQIAGTSDAERRSGQHVIDGAVVLGNAVYWDVRTNATRGVLMKYDLTAGKTSTAYTGPIAAQFAAVRVSAAGVIVGQPGGGFALRVHAALPSAVARLLTSQSALTLGSDGTAYAWFDQLKQTVSWWSPGQAVRTVHTTLGQPDGDDTLPRVDVAGPYVFYSGPQLQVIDTRSGAVATLPNVVLATGGDYVGTYVTAHHSSEQAGVVDTSALPALTC